MLCSFLSGGAGAVFCAERVKDCFFDFWGRELGTGGERKWVAVGSRGGRSGLSGRRGCCRAQDPKIAPRLIAGTLGLSLMQCLPNLGHFLRQPFFIRQR